MKTVQTVVKFAMARDKEKLPRPFLIVVPHQRDASIEYEYEAWREWYEAGAPDDWDYPAGSEAWHDVRDIHVFETVEDVQMCLRNYDRGHLHQGAKVRVLLEKEMVEQGLFEELEVDED